MAVGQGDVATIPEAKWIANSIKGSKLIMIPKAAYTALVLNKQSK
jgi:hypothetical protein